MENSNIMRIFSFIALLIFAGFVHSSEVQSARIVSILSGPEYGNSVLINLDPHPNQQNCATSTSHDYAFDISSIGGEALLSLVISAYFSGVSVSVIGSDNCALIDGVEDLSDIQL